ncbi:KICSTOR complex protein ITFG2 isoform X2 [Myotis myotis]|uniref:KICSTOR complex protein ITFG2 isoform X2 n=1 Tax=Myotis myotis TaxID=51298 RepID=UPI0017495395|nr:KICSTOR complex protein ITFG2 isoform X2 [Myotis myotis]
MRSVSYVQRVALEFSGSLFPHAICLGDVDNDTLNELVVGDTSGKLSVYKNDDSRPWLTCSCQGMLTCVGVGDVCNKGKNLVVAVSAEGWFHLCDLTPARTLDASGHHETLMGEEQRPVFKQHIPANTKVMLISDIDGDGCCELVVGYTDRVVRAFRWEDLGEGTEHLTGQLVSLKKWTLEGQVDSLSVTLGPLGVPELMVSQPGCAYAVLLCTWNKDARHSTTSEGTTEGISPPVSCPQGDPGCPRCCAAPDIRPHPQQECLYSPHRQHQTRPHCGEWWLWPLCPLHPGWDTEAYGGSRQAVVVSAGGPPAFRPREIGCHGLYACKEGRNNPCLVYVTFNQKIYVYWEVQLERMESTNLLKLLEAEPEYQGLLQELGLDPDDLPAARTLVHQTLYHPDQPPQCAPASLQDPT